MRTVWEPEPWLWHVAERLLALPGGRLLAGHPELALFTVDVRAEQMTCFVLARNPLVDVEAALPALQLVVEDATYWFMADRQPWPTIVFDSPRWSLPGWRTFVGRSEADLWWRSPQRAATVQRLEAHGLVREGHDEELASHVCCWGVTMLLEVIRHLARSDPWRARFAPAGEVANWCASQNPAVARQLAERAHDLPDLHERMLEDPVDAEALMCSYGEGAVKVELLRELAARPEPWVRRYACRPEVPEDVARRLATDPHPEVARALAQNVPSLPEDVRGILVLRGLVVDVG